MKIQEVGPQDVESIIALQNQSTGSPWTKEGAQTLLEDPSICCLGAKGNDKIVGFIMVRMAADEGDIIEFVVEKSYRNQGIGRALYKFMEQVCLKNKLKDLFLEVLQINIQAQKFYKNEGFVEIALREGYYRSAKGLLTAILMKKELVIPPQ